jgi:Zn-finger protein
MNETLICETCGKKWKREVSRGRKPKNCLKCIVKIESQKVKENKPLRLVEAKKKTVKKVETETEIKIETETKKTFDNLTKSKVYQSLYPLPDNSKELFNETKNGSKWRCPNCKYVIDVPVGVTSIPTHTCSFAVNKVYLCERIG